MRHGRRDLNHGAVKAALVAVCGSDNVRDTADLGDGFPDLVVGWRGGTFMLEVKSSAKAKLRPDQERLMGTWRGGPWIRVDSPEDALRAIGCRVAAG